MKNAQTNIGMKEKRPVFIFGAVLILLLAAVMRLILLADIPPGLAQDEVLNADVANFIRQGYHALFFREGYGHEPLYHYWSVPFQVLFGDNVLSIRLPSVYLGLLLIAVTMRWVKREFGPVPALITGTGLAVSWWPIIFSRIGIRPIMEPFFLLIFAWFWPKKPWLAGLFLGLSVYTYTGARVVFAIPVLIFIYWFFADKWREELVGKLFNWRLPKSQIAALIVLISALIVVLPLAIVLWIDPTLQQRVDQLQGPIQAMLSGNFQPVLSSILATVGAFSFSGDPRWTYSLPGRPLFDWVTAIFFYGGLIITLVRFKNPKYAFVLIWLVVGLFPSAVTPQAPSTIRMIGAMPVVYLMPTISLTWLWHYFKKAKGKIRATSPLALGLIIFTSLLALNLFLTIRDGFIRWPNAAQTHEKYQTIFLDIARDLVENPVDGLVIADGFYRPITADSLTRNMAKKIPVRWIQTGNDVAGAIILPSDDEAQLFVPEYAAPDPDLLGIAGINPRPIYRSEGNPSYAVYNLPQIPALPLDEEITFAGKITLVGYDISGLEDEQSIQLFFIWRVDDNLPSDLASFVHWIDSQGNLISQYDGFDAAPDTLQVNDLVIQRAILPISGSDWDEAGSFQVGLYTRHDSNRLLRDDGPPEIRDRVIISWDAAFNQN